MGGEGVWKSSIIHTLINVDYHTRDHIKDDDQICGHVARMGSRGKHEQETLNGTDRSRELHLDQKKILKFTLNKYDVTMWTTPIGPITRISGCSL